MTLFEISGLGSLNMDKIRIWAASAVITKIPLHIDLLINPFI